MKDLEVEGTEVKYTMVFSRLFVPMTQDRTTYWACIDFASEPRGETMRVTIWKLVAPETDEWVHAPKAEALFHELAVKYGITAAIVGLFDKARCREDAFQKQLVRYGPYGTQPPMWEGRVVAAPERSAELGVKLQFRRSIVFPERLVDAPPSDEDFGAALALERARSARYREEADRLRSELDEARALLVAKPLPGAELATARAELEEAKADVQRLGEESAFLVQRHASAKDRAEQAEADLRRERQTHEETTIKLEGMRDDRRQAEGRVRTLEAEIDALRSARSEISPAQLESALRRTQTAEEACAKMTIVAKEESGRADDEVRLRAAAEREVAALKQTIRELRDKLDANRSAVPALETLHREIDELKRQLRECADKRGDASFRDASPPPSLVAVRTVSDPREQSLPIAPPNQQKSKIDYMREEEAKDEVNLLKPWRSLLVRVSVATPDCPKADPKPYCQFFGNAELADMVTKLMRVLLSQAWTQETVPMIHLPADLKTVLATYVALVAFESHWDPVSFLSKCRLLLPKDTKQALTEDALKQILAHFLNIKAEEVQGWCMGYSLELLESQWGFELEAFRRKEGPPVSKDASLDKKVVPHLFACLYDMGETKAADRDPLLLGSIGPKRARLQLIPPRRLTIPHPVHKSTVVHLTWEWPASPAS